MKKTETNDGKKGGLLKGKPHYDKDGNSLGGIKAIVVDSGKPVELEGGEVIINKEASKKYWKELSKINQSAGNGVPILPPNKYDEDPTEYKDGGRIIDFNPNHVPSKRIINYAKTIKQKHPKIWDLGGNIFGNEAFINLERVSKRGYWLESEEWMYIKWRSYVARHQHDFRIEGVIAMLKWADIVNKGWAYMKDLIEAKIEKTTKMKKGGTTTEAYKQQYNEKYNYKPNESHSLEEIHTDTGISLKGLQEIYNKGIGAYKTNPSSVRPNVKSKEQWAMARVYSAVMGGKASEVDANELKMELGGQIKLLAPNGKPSNLTEEQYKLVRTPSFKKWFGDWENDPQNASKIVDENGEPMMVYHGTNSNFNTFELNTAGKRFNEEGNTNSENGDYGMWGVGFYFSPIKKVSQRYGKKLMKLFLNIRNPFIRNPNLTGSNTEFKAVYGKIESLKLREDILSKGYDGVMHYEAGQKNQLMQIISFFPNQIKLADGKNFTFDKSNDDIRFENGGEIEKYKEQGILELNFYPTSSEHAKEYGIKAKNPLFIQNLTVKETKRLKNLDEYAKNNEHDVIFGHINQKAKFSKDKRKSSFSDVEMIKNWLHNNGYVINQDNNDFHKILTDKQDSVTMDIPLLIRTLELAREDVKSDAELHHVVENLLKLKNKKVLTMDDYEYIAKVKNKHIYKMKYGGNVNEAEEKPNFETHLNTYLNNNGIKFEHHNAELEIYNQELELNRLLS